jgi:hypothetical protein
MVLFLVTLEDGTGRNFLRAVTVPTALFGTFLDMLVLTLFLLSNALHVSVLLFRHP